MLILTKAFATRGQHFASRCIEMFFDACHFSYNFSFLFRPNSISLYPQLYSIVDVCTDFWRYNNKAICLVIW